MKPTNSVCAALIGFGMLAGTGTAFGQDPEIEKAAKRAWQQILAACDANKDGKMSRAEFGTIEKPSPASDQKFKAMDSNADGYVVESEYVAWVKSVTVRRK
jgi:Ca2+-binding EF-hand superfamily protein